MTTYFCAVAESLVTPKNKIQKFVIRADSEKEAASRAFTRLGLSGDAWNTSEPNFFRNNTGHRCKVYTDIDCLRKI